MATQAVAGYEGVLEVSTDGGTTHTAIAELRDVTLTLELEEIDATSKDSAGWRDSIPGLKRWSGSAEGLFVDGDAGQTALYDALVNGTTVQMRLRPSGAVSGDSEYTGDATITNWELASPLSDATATSVEFSGAGALTKATQV